MPDAAPPAQVVQPHDQPLLSSLTMSMPATDFRWWPELRQRTGDAVSARILSSWAHVATRPPGIALCWYRVRREHLDTVTELTGPEQFTQHPHVELVTNDMTFAPTDIVLCHGYVLAGFADLPT